MAITEARLQQAEMERGIEIPVIRIQASRGWASLKLWEVWEYRELLYFLVWRDVKVRYRQTTIGAAWVVLQPLMTMLIFTLVFRGFANVPSDGLPYSIFAFTALLPWQFFASALTRCTGSIVGQANLISKVYFPRLVVPLSATIAGLVDFGVALVMLFAMMIWFGIAPTWRILTLPLFLLLALIAALAVGLWLSALNVRYRDVGYVIPFLIQLWMFASPIAYPVSLVPERFRFLYSLNPMTGVIEGFRWALFGKLSIPLAPIVISAVAVIGLLWGGIFFFKRMQRTFADVV
jgi:homopolymeric O-antigen transport system permease protein